MATGPLHLVASIAASMQILWSPQASATPPSSSGVPSMTMSSPSTVACPPRSFTHAVTLARRSDSLSLRRPAFVSRVVPSLPAAMAARGGTRSGMEPTSMAQPLSRPGSTVASPFVRTT